MIFPLMALIGGTVLAWAAVLVCGDGPASVAASLATAITLPPALLTFTAVVRLTRRWPESGPTAVMAGTFVRMMVAVTCVAALGERASDFGTTPTALREWVTGFYLLTLGLETGLLWWQLSRPPQGAKDEPPAANIRG